MRASFKAFRELPYVQHVKKNPRLCCRDQKALIRYLEKCFREEDIVFDTELFEKYKKLIETYFPWELFPWEEFVLAMHDCVFRKADGQPRWKTLFCMMGRGAGKDGMIAAEAFCVSSELNGIRGYDVDICANNEEQALRPVDDLREFFESPKHERRIRKSYYWTKEMIECTKTRSKIKGRTNNPKSRDGMRSGIVIFNEVHQYENYKNINVFTTSLGKKKHPRRSYYTSNGNVRDGVLDDMLKKAKKILYQGANDRGMLPFICRLDSEKELHDEEMWQKANPSLPYMPDLMQEVRDEYEDWKAAPETLIDFVSKRMGLTPQSEEAAAVDWKNIEKTNRPLPDMSGWTCVAGIDYAKTTDWVSVVLHFKQGERRFDIAHSWICSQSKDLPRIEAPWEEWVDKHYITYVDDVEIAPERVADYIAEAGRKYNIVAVALDSYRYTLLSTALAKIGFRTENKNLILVKQRDICKVVPVIDHCFVQGLISWGDRPDMRWAANNTKRIPYMKNIGADKGSFVYAKIEHRSRKTDIFMAFVCCMCIEDMIVEYTPISQIAGGNPVISF